MLLQKDPYQYFTFAFPEPQYLGAKYSLLSWILGYIPAGIETALDAFSGSQSVAFLLKQLGIRTLTNDFLNFNYQIGLALIENQNEILTELDFEILYSDNPNKSKYTLIEDIYTDVFFERSQAIFLDNYRANVALLANQYKQALALTLINRSLTRKITMGHFGHTQALVYANNAQRIKRNPNLARPIKDILQDLLPKYNKAIFHNGKENKSYASNILELLPELLKTEKIDFVYFAPPYCDSHADYQSFYHLTETYTQYWHDKQFINRIRRYAPQLYSGFDKKKDAPAAFAQLFQAAQEIPHWLISYNNRSYPDIDTLKTMIAQYKNVEIVAKTYQNGRGGKGSVAGSQEILFVCKPKTTVFISKNIE